MYTQLCFNAELKEETPRQVISTLRWLLGEHDDMDGPLDGNLTDRTWSGMFNGWSFYHAPAGSKSFIRRNRGNEWYLSVLCDIKNYGGELEAFIEWIKPWVAPRGQDKTFLGYTRYEESDEPTLIYLDLGYMGDEE